MAFSNPFEKLPAELTTAVLGLLEPTDLQSLINADPHMLRVFLQHELVVLRPLRRNIFNQFTGQRLTQAAIACRLRQLESTPLSRDRAKYEEVVKPILTQSPEAVPVTTLNLGSISHLDRLFREVQAFTSAYSKDAWEMTQNAVADSYIGCRRVPARLPLSVPLSRGEREMIQWAYLLFESYRHTLWFSKSFVLEHYCPEQPAPSCHILGEFTYGNKLGRIRPFYAVLGFLLREYRRLLSQVDDILEGESSDITSQAQTSEFLNCSSHDILQFPAYLCSLGYRALLDCEEIGNPTARVVSLYMQYSQLKQDHHTCPLVVFVALKDSVDSLFDGTQTWHAFWTSGAFLFDPERLNQLDRHWWMEISIFGELAISGRYSDESDFEDGYEDESD
ncbi:hypothetical protein NW752_009154 [Fusarium irregulare]|uniref:F-box domain-containing protein n=1 Tax=Fusarium irregulare TaxID=2494466 RepID=A0A9W8PK50_9HYPO|nr:hypothetical protein NW766_008679 [Fusarium irregulare]KAJ4009979.1 hypothetical protein NW752_009154 [Fusarium irregulare]